MDIRCACLDGPLHDQVDQPDNRRFGSQVTQVLNIFQVTGLTADAHQYFVKPCPAKKGDYFEFFAEADLLCALSTCPHGDMSQPIWGPDAVADPVSICRPIGIEIYDLAASVLDGWRPPQPADYAGLHGMR